jgi:hypothetical protein
MKIDYLKRYNRKVREFYDKFCIDPYSAANAIGNSRAAFSRLTGYKSMIVSRPLEREEYITFIENVITRYREKIEDMEKFLVNEKRM